MIDFDQVDRALAAAVLAAEIEGLSAVEMLGDSIDRDTFAVVEHDGEYHQTFGNSSRQPLNQVQIQCGIYLARTDVKAARRKLMQYLSPEGARSIPAALEADKTLGGKVKTSIVNGFRGSGREYQIGANYYVGAVIDVTVWA